MAVPAGTNLFAPAGNAGVRDCSDTIIRVVEPTGQCGQTEWHWGWAHIAMGRMSSSGDEFLGIC